MSEKSYVLVVTGGYNEAVAIANDMWDRGNLTHIFKDPGEILGFLGFETGTFKNQEEAINFFRKSVTGTEDRGPYPMLRKRINAMGLTGHNKLEVQKIIATCLIDIAELSGGAILYTSEE